MKGCRVLIKQDITLLLTLQVFSSKKSSAKSTSGGKVLGMDSLRSLESLDGRLLAAAVAGPVAAATAVAGPVSLRPIFLIMWQYGKI
jgi:hypothetical protein